MKKNSKNFAKSFDAFSNKVTKATGSPAAIISVFTFIILWGMTGPLFHFSDTWQLVVNTASSIITFLMVFIIQLSQNKDSAAVQLKLDELIAANLGASNRLIGVENLTEAELNVMKKLYIKQAEASKMKGDLFSAHSIDEAKQSGFDKVNIINVKKIHHGRRQKK